MDIKLKRHYKVIILFIFTIFFLGIVIGETMMVPYSSGNQLNVSANPNNIENEIYIFDDSLVHEIEIDMTKEDYESMITTFNETGEKEYFPADITIDGITIKNVGLRLKGNSSLNGLFRKNSTSQDVQAPYLIKLDKYVDGQSYQGYTEIAVRTGSFNAGSALLEEPLSLFIYQEAGQVVPEYSYASVKVSDDKAYYYVLCENIDGNYIEKHFTGTDGILYKKGNSADFSYKGEDQAKYVSEYEQKTNKKNEDYTKLIAFLKFVSESSDEEFEKELPDWLELDSFMAMIAINELIDNQDSFSGQSRNFYLYYNPETQKFTMLAWDFNLAFGGFGGAGNRGMQDRDGNMALQVPVDMPPMDFNMSTQRPEGVNNRDMNRSIMRPEGMLGMDTNRTFQRQEEMGDIKQGGQMQGSNLLKERFFANEKFSQMYQEKYDELSKKIYCDDSLVKEIEYIAKVFTEYNKENNILDQNTYDAKVQKMIEYVNQKREALCQ